MPRYRGGKQKIDGDEETESFIEGPVCVCGARLEGNCVHGVHDRFAFYGWRNKFQEPDGVAGGEEHEQNCGDNPKLSSYAPCKALATGLSFTRKSALGFAG